MSCLSLKFICSVVLLAVVFIKTSDGQAYNTQYQSNNNYPMNYQNQPYQTAPCNDLLCQTNECCVETYKGPICVALNASNPQALCIRAKKCSSNADCPTLAGCCQTIPDITAFRSNSYSSAANTYGNTNSYGYTPANNAYVNYPYTPVNSGYGTIPSYSDARNFKDGFCRAQVVNQGRACFEPIDGVQASGCPCRSPLTCIIALEPFPIGTCEQPNGR